MLLHPGLREAGDYGRRIAGGLPADFGFSSLMFPPVGPAGAPGLRRGAAGVQAVRPDAQDYGSGQAHGE